MHFSRFVGLTVFHCHILAHEDDGELRRGDAGPA
jgi:FtsP/CotA-like multicopper oxidase with cupredoxin domain